MCDCVRCLYMHACMQGVTPWAVTGDHVTDTAESFNFRKKRTIEAWKRAQSVCGSEEEAFGSHRCLHSHTHTHTHTHTYTHSHTHIHTLTHTHITSLLQQLRDIS